MARRPLSPSGFEQQLVALAASRARDLACLTTKPKPHRRTPKRVNVNEQYEAAYWSKRFATTPEKLKAAVKKVGVMVEDVEKELKGK